MLGIEGAELTCTYHVNSFFTDYGIRPPCKSGVLPDEELTEVARRGGLAVLNHPDTNQPPEWFARLYREHSVESFVGIELASDDPATTESYSTLWDQLLGELMPARPIWGFGTSDTHILAMTRFAFTVFLLHELTTDGVKDAMRRGQFYSVVRATTRATTRRWRTCERRSSVTRTPVRFACSSILLRCRGDSGGGSSGAPRTRSRVLRIPALRVAAIVRLPRPDDNASWNRRRGVAC
jgi:hypothetical protein